MSTEDDDAGGMATWWITLVAVLSTLVGPRDEHEACLALGVLDTRRAAAFASGSAEPLTDVYADETAQEADRLAVRAYRVRGLRVVGAAMRRSSCRVVHERPGRVRLEVVDALGPTWAVDTTGTAEQLPRDRATRHVVTLVERDGAWRIGGVRQASQ